MRWYRAVVVMLLLSCVRVQIRRWPRVIAIIIVYGVTVVVGVIPRAAAATTAVSTVI